MQLMRLEGMERRHSQSHGPIRPRAQEMRWRTELGQLFEWRHVFDDVDGSFCVSVQQVAFRASGACRREQDLLSIGLMAV